MYKAVSYGVIGLNVPLPEGIEFAARHGFEGLEIHPDQALEAGLDTIQEQLKKYHMRNAGFGLPMEYKAADRAEFDKGAELLKRQAETAAKLGAKGCCTWILPFHETMTYDEQFAFLAERLSVYAKILKDAGIKLGLEFIGPETARKGQPHEFVHTLPQMMELCGAVGNCGLLLDAHHCFTAGHSMHEIGKLRKEQIVLVHINDAPEGFALEDQPDSPRCLPGETGVIDIGTFMNGLKEIGYDGPVVTEPFSERLKEMSDRDTVMEAVISSMNAVWPN